MLSIKITKIPLYFYTTTKYTITIKKSSMKHSKLLDITILLFSHDNIWLYKNPQNEMFPCHCSQIGKRDRG
jgi:hypothetical protein